MTYKIEKSNKTGEYELTIPDRRYNTDTSLLLIGRNVANYGMDLNQNFIHLLDNFCNSTPPINPISGQTWYKTTNQKMYVYDGKHWIELGYTLPPDIPNDAISNAILDISLSDLLPKTGGEITGKLILKENTTNDNEYSAVTKEYVDRFKNTDTDFYVPLTGSLRQLSGPIITSNAVSDTNSNTIATKKYVDETLPYFIFDVDHELVKKDGITNEIVGYSNSVVIQNTNHVYAYGMVYIPVGVNNVNLPVSLLTQNTECFRISVTVTNGSNKFYITDNQVTVFVSAFHNTTDNVITFTVYGTPNEMIPVHFTLTGLI